MRIIYVGKHNNIKSNDDEGAITKSLLELGHQVKLVKENNLTDFISRDSDLLLFNHCKSLDILDKIKIPKVFWCFDRIYWDDVRLDSRNNQRTEWARQALEISEVGFFTDGDWVAKDTTGKAVWLTQGFNQYLTPATPSGEDKGTILFTGGGRDYGREAFVSEMRQTYGDRFLHISKGVHGQALAQLITDASVVVAPPSPVTNKYWSNRVYLTLGLGGFLLHPYTQGLEQSVSPLMMYEDMDHLHYQIDWWAKNVEYRERVRVSGQLQIFAHHTYKHRVAQLIKEVENRL